MEKAIVYQTMQKEVRFGRWRAGTEGFVDHDREYGFDDYIFRGCG